MTSNDDGAIKCDAIAATIVAKVKAANATNQPEVAA